MEQGMKNEPGKYDPECTAAREACDADGALLIVIGGDRGDGFAAQLPGPLVKPVIAILREVADQMEEAAELKKRMGSKRN